MNPSAEYPSTDPQSQSSTGPEATPPTVGSQAVPEVALPPAPETPRQSLPVLPTQPQSYVGTSEGIVVSKGPRHGKRNLLIILIVLLVILIGGAAAYLYLHKTKQSPPTTSSKTTAGTAQKAAPPMSTAAQIVPLYTYVNKATKTLLVTDGSQKKLATLELSGTNTTFSVLANNNNDVLVREWTGGASDSASTDEYDIVNQAGSVARLSSKVASIIADPSNVGAGYFDSTSNYVYLNCGNSGCSLQDLNLTTGVVTTINTTPGSCDKQGMGCPVALLGVSSGDIAYTVVYPATPKTAPGTLTLVDLQTKKQTASFPMTDQSLNTANLSPDQKYLVYTPVSNQQTISLMDLTSGKTTQVTSKTVAGAVYTWSPDSSTVAFEVNTGNDAQIGYFTVANPTVTVSQNYGTKTYNNVGISGWTSNDTLDYEYDKTTTANSFVGASNTATEYSLNVSTGKVAAQSAPNGYVAVPVMD